MLEQGCDKMERSAGAANAGPYDELLGEVVVVDTDSSFTYLGRLLEADATFLKLEEVDVHEATRDGRSKERYVSETRGIGVRANRRLTWVCLSRVVSISRLADVISF